MIDKEYVMIGMLTLGPLLFMLGGKLNKALRRYALPLLLAVGASLLGVPIIRCIGIGMLMIGALSLGYGEESPLWKRILTISTFGLCLLPLMTGLNGILIALPPLSFGVGYWLSLKYHFVSWKIIEGLGGFGLAATIILMSLWR